MLLGPVELRVAGVAHSFSAGKEERLVVSLALNAGRLVTVDTLIDRLWDGDPPDNARASVHTHVSRLRRKLREAGVAPHAQPLSRRHHAYVLEESSVSVDSLRFRKLTDQARAAAARGEDERVVELLTQARGLWRGEALAGMEGLWPQQVRRQFAEKHADAVLTQSAACLRLGRYPDLIPDLTDLAQEAPEDELLGIQLMLACYGAGRYPEAMRVHQRIRTVLRTEHGTSPGPRLSRLHEDMLRRRPVEELVRECLGEARVVAEDEEGGSSLSDGPARNLGVTEEPRQTIGSAPVSALPPYAPVIGRDREIQHVTEAVSTTESETGIVLVTGAPGTGKTALAIELARTLGERYPDRQLYLNLLAHAGSQSPLTPEEALTSLVRMTRGHEQSVPRGLGELTTLWRTLLSQLRCVVVLDDVKDTAQVGPLLPGGSNSLVLVTSRRRLGGLPRALTVPLEVLAPRDAISMFRGIVGPERTRDHAEVAKIVRLCGYLPLAIEVAGYRLRGRPAWRLDTLGERLERMPGRLRELRDADRQVERVLAVSYEALAPAERRAFRAMSAHPGADIPLEAAAALLDCSPSRADTLLEELLTSHLLQETEANRYRFHDLLNELARSLAEEHDSEEEREAAMFRLLSFYERVAARADALAYPHSLQPPAEATPVTDSLPFPATADGARAWFLAERGALLALEEYARTHGAPDQAALLARHLFAFLDAEGYWQDACAVAAHAAAFWRTRGRGASLGHSLLALSFAHCQLSDYPSARRAAEEALQLGRASGDSVVEGEALRLLGVLDWHGAHYTEALEYFQRALSIKEAAGDVYDVSRMLNNLGISKRHLAEHDEAIRYMSAAIEGFRSLGDLRRVGSALSNLSTVYLDIKDHEAAQRCLEESVSLLDRLGNRYESATVHANLADLLVRSGEPGKALSVYRESLSAFQLLHDQKSQLNCLNGIGFAYVAMGRHAEAVEQFRTARRLAERLGSPHDEIEALIGIGRAESALGRYEAAVADLRKAVALAGRAQEVDEEVRARALLAHALQSKGDVPLAYAEAKSALFALKGKPHPDRAAIQRVFSELRQVITGVSYREFH
ncbi:AfsR/SARP family transcriptional regulator [Streptomyces physcomitrii]